MQKVKVITLNVNGIRAAKKKRVVSMDRFTESRLCMYSGGESAKKDLDQVSLI